VLALVLMGSVNTGPRTMTQPQQGPAGMCGKDGKCWHDVKDDSPAPTAVLASRADGGANTGPEDDDPAQQGLWLACAGRMECW
jgi:hypothetical protein